MVPTKVYPKGTAWIKQTFNSSEDSVDLNNLYAPFKRADYLLFRGLDSHLPTGIAQSRLFKPVQKTLLVSRSSISYS
jgi:hypothetical protein